MKRTALIVWTLLKVATAILVVVWWVLHLRELDSYLGIWLPGWARLPGLVLLIVGGLVVLVCGGVLSNRGILTSGNGVLPTEFVAFGPFRYVRNPMSLGVVLLFFGLGLYESSLSLVVFAALLFFSLHLVVIYVEEPGLEKRFGENYRLYKRSVNRWLPKF